MKRVIETKNLRLYEVSITHGDDESIDMSGFIDGMMITEHMGNKFTTATIGIINQYSLTEELPCNGDEIVKISWDSGEGSEVRTLSFFVSNIPAVLTEKQEEKFQLKCISTNFLPFIKMDQFKTVQNDKPSCEMIEALLSHYGIDVDIATRDAETLSYLPFRRDITLTIDDIRFLPTEPHVLYEVDGVMYYRSWDELFEQDEVFLFNNLSIVSGGEYEARTIKELTKNDILSIKSASENGLAGYEFFDIDIYEDKYEIVDVTNDVSDEYDYDITKKNIEVTKSSYNKEDLIVSNFIRGAFQVPDSKPILGKLIDLVIYKGEDEGKDTSSYSGEWLVYSVLHIIDTNFVYKQRVQLVRKNK